MDVNEAYCSQHFAIYTNIESLCQTPETNAMLYINYISNFKKRQAVKQGGVRSVIYGLIVRIKGTYGCRTPWGSLRERHYALLSVRATGPF